MSDMANLMQRITEETAHLRSLGFSESVISGGTFGGVKLTSCLTCGATVALTAAIEGETHPLDLHKAWHEQDPR